MTEPARAPAVRFPPPLVFLGFVLLGPLIERFVALPRLALPWPLGLLLIAPGIALIAVAVGLFRKHGEDPQPWTPTTEVIQTGVYAWTRNPMYLGMALIAAGLAIILHSAVALALVPVAMIVIQTLVIAREEAFLASVFGAPYAAYRRKVRRWI